MGQVLIKTKSWTICGSDIRAIYRSRGTDNRWKIHPEDLVTNRFPLEKADEAYALMATEKSGKVAVVFDEELKVGCQSLKA
jgi:threonine dehydrogenase-like Zn-dependent dehydrogenase